MWMNELSFSEMDKNETQNDRSWTRPNQRLDKVSKAPLFRHQATPGFLAIDAF
jgi:hypothetical protein